MKVKLFKFQSEAVAELEAKLSMAQQFASPETPQAVSFSAPTGSGKTVVMAKLFENIFYGGGTLEAQPDAVIVWVSDMPELNEQTRRKIERQSDRIKVRQLVNIDAGFDAELLEDGVIFFVNTQKLGDEKLLTTEGDRRQFSIWKTLAATARSKAGRFYIVIDEAHRGMAGARAAKEARTIMQRFVLGHAESGFPMMPLVVGVSATPRRFLELLEQAPHTVQKVLVASEKVRASGLLKDRIVIHHSHDTATPEMSLLVEAARRWADISSKWKTYSEEEEDAPVAPILVVQVENGTETLWTRTDLTDVVAAIEEAVGRPLREGEIAHALHDAPDLKVSGKLIRRVEASRIEETAGIGVVLFKNSLSTGWDCPRAEVMMSFRNAEDHTYIAQLLGRMVRTPLARRIEKRAELNDVHLFLPHFDREGVKSVIDDLQNVEDVPPAETGSSDELVVLQRRNGTDELFAALDEVFTYRVGKVREQPSLRRLVALARGLTIDGIDENAWQVCKQQVVSWMVDEVVTLRGEEQFDQALDAVTRVRLATTTLGDISGAPDSGYEVATSSIDIDRMFEAAGRALGNGLHMAFWQAQADRDAREVKIELILLARSHSGMTALEHRAEAAFDELIDRHKQTIRKLKEGRRQSYEKLRLSAGKPVAVEWRLPETIDFRRPPDAQHWSKHLYVEFDQSFKAEMGEWEKGVIGEELHNEDVVGWLRNVARKPWAFEVPYRSGGVFRALFPDFVVLRQTGSALVVDILEPHDPSLADNFEKAVGLAEFAERYGDRFGRIQLIRKRRSPAGADYFSRLEINSTAVQKELRLVTSNPQLDQLFEEFAS